MILYYGKDSKIKAACPKAQSFYDTELKRCVSGVEFQFTNASNDQLYEALSTFASKNAVEVRTYRPMNPWSKVLAYTTNSKVVYLNAWKLNRSVASIVGTIVHEMVHCADNSESKYTFGHGDNSSHKKEYSVPYYLGNYALKWAEKL